MEKLKLTISNNNESVEFYVEDGVNATVRLGDILLKVKAESEE
jgi:hypothetical protein